MLHIGAACTIQLLDVVVSRMRTDRVLRTQHRRVASANTIPCAVCRVLVPGSVACEGMYGRRTDDVRAKRHVVDSV